MITRYGRVMLLSGDQEIAQALADGAMEVRQLKEAAASRAEARLAVMLPRDAAAWQKKIEFAHMVYDSVTVPEPVWRQRLEVGWCRVWLGLLGWMDYFREWWIRGGAA